MTVALFHSAFHTLGGAEILVATQAQYLRREGLEVCVATLSFDAARWATWFEGIPVRVASQLSWLEKLRRPTTRLQRLVPKIEACLTDCRAVIAGNYPTNILLGASSSSAKRVWCCTEPSRDLHLAETNPRLHARTLSSSRGSSDAESDYARRWAKHRVASQRSKMSSLIAYDIEMTQRIEDLYSISEFGRDNVRRLYGRNDVGVICPVVRFPAQRHRHRTGLDRSGLRILAHSRLEIPKNVETVLRGFALFVASNPQAKLEIVGEGSERRRLESLVSELGVTSAVRFHGYLKKDALDAVYDTCDVFAMLPLDEPFGMVFPEAAARGLLLVGPDHGGPFEILDGGRLGFACDPFSPEAVSETFERIWACSDAEVDALRARADDACRNRYDEKTIGPQLLRAIGGASADARAIHTSAAP